VRRFASRRGTLLSRPLRVCPPSGQFYPQIPWRTLDPNHRILAPQRSRFTHYYFYIRDEVLGPMVMRVGSFFPFQATYYLNGHSFMEQD